MGSRLEIRSNRRSLVEEDSLSSVGAIVMVGLPITWRLKVYQTFVGYFERRNTNLGWEHRKVCR